MLHRRILSEAPYCPVINIGQRHYNAVTGKDSRINYRHDNLPGLELNDVNKKACVPLFLLFPLLDANGNRLRTERRTVRAVRKIGEQQLQAVFARGEINHDFGLPTTKVTVPVVGRYRLIQIG
jgi:predicted transcriptional regulator